MNLIPLMLLIVLILLFVKTQPSSNRLIGVVLLVSIVLVLCLQDVNILGIGKLFSNTYLVKDNSL